MLSLRLKDSSGPLPTDTFEILNDTTVVGFCQLRHTKSKSDVMPAGFESTIYYEIHPEYRGKGYATVALGLLLDKARELVMNEVIITVEEDNISSQKVIESNGGVLVDTQPMVGSSKLARKYRVDL